MGTLSLIPSLVVKLIPTVTVTRASHSSYRSSIQCDGTVARTDVKNIYLQYPVVAKTIEVQPGDYVVKGQRLFTIDKEATVSAITEVLSQSTSLPAFLNLEELAENLGAALKAVSYTHLIKKPLSSSNHSHFTLPFQKNQEVSKKRKKP